MFVKTRILEGVLIQALGSDDNKAVNKPILSERKSVICDLIFPQTQTLLAVVDGVVVSKLAIIGELDRMLVRFAEQRHPLSVCLARLDQLVVL